MTRDPIVVQALELLECEVRECEVFPSPDAVRDYLRLLIGAREYEVFVCVFLDAQNRLIKTEEMFRGTLTQTSIYPREVVKEALTCNAAAVILAHNHPSGSDLPSRADAALTITLKQALALIDVRVLDHMIVTRTTVMSFAERGLLYSHPGPCGQGWFGGLGWLFQREVKLPRDAKPPIPCPVFHPGAPSEFVSHQGVLTMSTNYFGTLYAVNVSDHIEKKGGFSYLSWPYAVAQLRLADPAATWEVRRFNGLPYQSTDLGVFVEVAVSVQGITLSQIHPVLDSRNRPLIAPTAFDINSSIQRCLVKAIALHGLGLYIYAGEDLPVATHETTAANDAPTQSTEVSAPRSEVRHIDVTISGPQQAQIHKLVVQTGTDLSRLLEHFSIAKLADLPAAEFVRVVRTLENRRAA